MKQDSAKKYEIKTLVKVNAGQLIRWRADKTWSQLRAAKFAGVSLPTYKKAEYGQLIQLGKAGKISQRTGVPIEGLEERSA